ncbi:enoyl-CoA hydratase/isomerase family protein [Geomonas sp. Red69]|uniref:Enoyl-CoA hydratase/isomerase family protein n=1 Tax=Geomonas diazotrophica TaxID=2843197 RepID=A0ABX8JG69_9BACT|nr:MULTISPECIES: enoyl-CoA hydratase-related protein [Geomonas]MBU5636241.1 enoyl-CoA hydratase/isomerase family protein [Geomonas diazotrophica]QWV96136.1 enoyl-CoA hydratase/isomerase family protein [Geomonas nitrogeniifigens]QXE85203.1 enoyl-CoA hydratase/isomerase family protein [Geomonas nitrogeniifigens]
MENQNILCEIVEGVATVTVNRPASLNALNSQVLGELECTLYKLEQDPAVRVVILTGAGEKAFVAGADIKEMADMTSFEGHRFALQGQRVMLFMEKMSKPVIAAVNGYALGGGLELALACDVIYASDNAKLGFPEVTLGIIPGFGGTQNLSRLIGPNRAKELVYSGRMINAQKALAWGVVNEVVAQAELAAKALELAREIAKNGSLGVGYAKNAIVNGLNMTKEDGFRYESSLFGVLFATEDQKEGMGAFVEKRKAQFQGK